MSKLVYTVTWGIKNQPFFVAEHTFVDFHVKYCFVERKPINSFQVNLEFYVGRNSDTMIHYDAIRTVQESFILHRQTQIHRAQSGRLQFNRNKSFKLNYSISLFEHDIALQENITLIAFALWTLPTLNSLNWFIWSCSEKFI